MTVARFHSFIGRIAVALLILSTAWVEAAELSMPVRQLIEGRCLDCHDAETRKGGMNLELMVDRFDPATDLDRWVKVESALLEARMPPPKKSPLTPAQVQAFSNWFETVFVRPGGRQLAGPTSPRRLTREELQNTLEDILQVDLRVEVNNSRLHVIPDTIIEKFFSPGVQGSSGFSNDADTLRREPLDVASYARCLSLILATAFSQDKAMTHLFGGKGLRPDLPLKEAREILDRFGRSAFRRPMTEEETEAFTGVYRKTLTKASSSEAMQSAMLAILLSPSFLYRFEDPVSGQTPVIGRELAIRLSYFLWSSVPDQELWDLAARGELRKPEVLRQQVRRMLRDPRRIALAENLGGEWFDYKKLRQQSTVDKRSDKMAGFFRTQYEEALLFFDSLIRHDQSLFHLVDADWAYLNKHQRKIYRLKTRRKSFPAESALPQLSLHYRTVSRQVMERPYEYQHAALDLVGLKDPNRGGFITMGSTLSATSTPNRTSPIRRGVWVLERILGEHFVQPENVPDLEETEKKAKAKNLNLNPLELLKQHSSQQGCASCHQYIDPIGFGLEGFDPMGISRTLTELNPLGEKLQWSPEITPGQYMSHTWSLKRSLEPGVEVRVFFQWTHGPHRLNVRNVRLASGDLSIADEHVGYTGSLSHENVWFFDLPQDAPREGWRLTAEIQGGGGTNSHGAITVSLPRDKPRGFQMPGGKPFASPAELKQLLLEDYREPIIDNAIRRVMAYALGRKPGPIDRPAIRKIRAELEAEHYRMPALLEAVVLSYPFRHKQFE